MSNRPTIKHVRAALARFCHAAQLPFVDSDGEAASNYVGYCPQEKLDWILPSSTIEEPKVCWQKEAFFVDYQSVYGGYAICQYSGGSGERSPFWTTRHNAEITIRLLNALTTGVRIGKGERVL